MYMEKFGERLKDLREERDLTQAELAGILGVAPNTISRWERGITRPRYNVLLKIAEFFNVDVDYLLLGKKQEASSELSKDLEANEEKAKSNIKTIVARIIKCTVQALKFVGIAALIARAFCLAYESPDLSVAEGLTILAYIIFVVFWFVFSLILDKGLDSYYSVISTLRGAYERLFQ